MMANKKTLERACDARFEPYARESTLQVGIDIVVIAVVFIGLWFISLYADIKFPLGICIVLVAGYSLIAILLHYRVLMQAVIDKRKGDFVTETVRINRCKEERLFFAGDRLGYSYISKLYPKEMAVEKVKITVTDCNGKTKTLRSVMSFRRILVFAFLDKYQIEYIQVVYLKRSKIVIWYALTEETDEQLSNKEKRILEKTMHRLNTTT